MKNIAELERRITMLEREVAALKPDKKGCQDDADDIRDGLYRKHHDEGKTFREVIVRSPSSDYLERDEKKW